MIDILVISHACFMAVNRKVYQLFLKDGYKIEIIAPAELNFPAGRKKANPPLPGDPPIHFLSLVGDNPRTYFFAGLIEKLDTLKPATVLLDNDPVSKMAGITGRWCLDNNARLFCISNENLSLAILETIKRRGMRNLPAAVYKKCLLIQNKSLVHGVFCINSDGKKIFEGEGFKNVRQIPLGFDPAIFYPDPGKRAAIREKEGLTKTVIAYFGRLIPEKGIHMLISALQQIKDADWILMMDRFDEYASGYNQEIKELISHAGISDRVIYVHPDHVEIAAYMNAADIIVVPSVSTPVWKEQYGRVAAEAMACGKIVVASKSGALPELLNGHGVIFQEGDVNKLTEILRRLLNNIGSEGLDLEKASGYAYEKLSIHKQKELLALAFAGHHHRSI